MTGTIEERISDLDEKMERLNNQKKALMARKKQQERKARTKRLIEHGAILEGVIPIAEDMSNEELKEFLIYAFETPYVKDYIRRNFNNPFARE